MSKLPNTPKRFTAGSTSPDGDIKRMLLDHTNYYATTGGHGACKGCGEVTAIRLVTSMSRALGDERRAAHVEELEELIENLTAKRDGLGRRRQATRQRPHRPRYWSSSTRRCTSRRPDPPVDGPAPTVVANSTGCSSVYASTMPFTPYLDPWVNSLFQDAQPLASGIYEGISTAQVARGQGGASGAARARGRLRPRGRTARSFSTLAWHDFTRGRAQPHAERPHDRWRRRELRHRLRSDVPRPRERHSRQDARAQHRRLLEHGRPGVDGQLHRPRRRPLQGAARRTTASTRAARTSHCSPRSTPACSRAPRRPRCTATSSPPQCGCSRTKRAQR